MNISSTRFGILNVPAETLLTFPSGLLGFPEWTRYVMLDHDTDAPFKWLHCAEEASLAFVVIDPALFNANYHVTISPEARGEVEGNEADELGLAVILTIPSADPSAVTANLRGPAPHEPSHETLQATRAFRGLSHPISGISSFKVPLSIARFGRLPSVLPFSKTRDQ